MLEETNDNLQQVIGHMKNLLQVVEFEIVDQALLRISLKINKRIWDTPRNVVSFLQRTLPHHQGHESGDLSAQITTLTINLVSHESLFKWYKANTQDPEQSWPQHPPPTICPTFNKKFKKRLYCHTDFLIQWEREPHETVTWHPHINLWQFKN